MSFERTSSVSLGVRTFGVLALVTHGQEEKIKIRDEEIK